MRQPSHRPRTEDSKLVPVVNGRAQFADTLRQFRDELGRNEAAKRLKVHPDTLTRWIRLGAPVARVKTILGAVGRRNRMLRRNEIKRFTRDKELEYAKGTRQPEKKELAPPVEAEVALQELEMLRAEYSELLAAQVNIDENGKRLPRLTNKTLIRLGRRISENRLRFHELRALALMASEYPELRLATDATIYNIAILLSKKHRQPVKYFFNRFKSPTPSSLLRYGKL